MKKSGLDKYKKKVEKAKKKEEKTIEKAKKKAGIFFDIEEFKENLKKYNEASVMDSTDELKNNILTAHKNIQQKTTEIISRKTGIKVEDLKTTAHIDRKISDLKTELDKIKDVDKKHLNSAGKKLIKKINKKIELLDELKQAHIDETDLEAKLTILSEGSEDRKSEANREISEFITKSEEILNQEKKRESLKAATKEKLTKVTDKVKEHPVITAVATVTTVAVTVTAVCLIANINDRNKNNNNNSLNAGVYSNLTNKEVKEYVKELMKLGYPEYSASQMAANFDKATLDKILGSPFILGVDEYAIAQGFNLDYFVNGDYKAAREVYNLDVNSAVELVNRAHKIKISKFYGEDVEINKIVDILLSIDNKQLFTQDNANLAQSFNTSFNDVTEHVLFGQVSEDDYMKLSALQHFAKEGSDLDQFLTKYADLAKNVIKNPEDIEASNALYNFLQIFANTLNGFKNEDTELTDDKTFNSSATVDDYYDWYMAYNSFIAPLIPAFVNDTNFEQYEELQNKMISALSGPEFEQICGSARKQQ